MKGRVPGGVHKMSADELNDIPKPPTPQPNNSSHTTKKPFPRDEDWEEGITN